MYHECYSLNFLGGVTLPKYCTVMFCRPIELIEYFNEVISKTPIRCLALLCFEIRTASKRKNGRMAANPC